MLSEHTVRESVSNSNKWCGFRYLIQRLTKGKLFIMNNNFLLFSSLLFMLSISFLCVGCDKRPDKHKNYNNNNTLSNDIINNPDLRRSLEKQREDEFQNMPLPTPSAPITMKSLLNADWTDTSGYWPGWGPYKYPTISQPLFGDESKQGLVIDRNVNHRIKPLGFQIPVDVLNKLTTSDLIETCLRYPNFDYSGTDAIQSGFENLRERFNGLQELYRRPDAADRLIEVYFKTPVDPHIPDSIGDNQDGTPLSKGLNRYLRLVNLHVMLGDENLLKKMEKEKQILLLKEALQKYEDMTSFKGYLGKDCENTEIAYLLTST